MIQSTGFISPVSIAELLLLVSDVWLPIYQAQAHQQARQKEILNYLGGVLRLMLSKRDIDQVLFAYL